MFNDEYEVEVARKLLIIKQAYIAGDYKEEPSEKVQIIPPEGHGPDDWIAGGGEEKKDIPDGPIDMQVFRSFSLQQRLEYARSHAIEGIDVVICVLCQGTGGEEMSMCEFCQGLGILWGKRNP